MYKEGLTFPIRYLSIFDEQKIACVEDIKRLKIYSEIHTEENIKKEILKELKNCTGTEIFSFLLNNFDNLLLTQVKFNKSEKLTSDYVLDDFDLTFFLNNSYVNFDLIEKALKNSEVYYTINRPAFYKKIHLLLYKNFFMKVAKNVNISSNTASTLYLDFDKDFQSFKNILQELQNKKPSDIDNFEYKLNYLRGVGFNISPQGGYFAEILSEIEESKQFSKNNIKQTFRNIFDECFELKSEITSTKRNRLFRPIYIEIMPKISGRLYENNPASQNNLTKEIKKFFS